VAEAAEIEATIRRTAGETRESARAKARQAGSRPKDRGPQGGGATWESSGYHVVEPGTAVEPYAPPRPSTADEMGGAVDTGAPAKVYGPGDQ